jgi:hypothetical protein
MKGEQLFIDYNSFIKHVAEAKNCSIEDVETKYLMTIQEFRQKMADKPKGSEEYKDFYNKEISGKEAGYWGSTRQRHCILDNRCSNIWLSGGLNIKFYDTEWDRNDCAKEYGFSGRLLKN